jgi:hypothetical protein
MAFSTGRESPVSRQSDDTVSIGMEEYQEKGWAHIWGIDARNKEE